MPERKDVFWRSHRFLVLALGLACLLMLVFGLRLASSAIYWSERRDLPIRGWMTLGFVAHSWRVDRDRLQDALDVTPEPGERVTLDQIADQSGRSPAEITAIVEQAIADAGVHK